MIHVHEDIFLSPRNPWALLIQCRTVGCSGSQLLPGSEGLQVWGLLQDGQGRAWQPRLVPPPQPEARHACRAALSLSIEHFPGDGDRPRPGQDVSPTGGNQDKDWRGEPKSDTALAWCSRVMGIGTGWEWVRGQNEGPGPGQATAWLRSDQAETMLDSICLNRLLSKKAGSPNGAVLMHFSQTSHIIVSKLALSASSQVPTRRGVVRPLKALSKTFLCFVYCYCRKGLQLALKNCFKSVRASRTLKRRNTVISTKSHLRGGSVCVPKYVFSSFNHVWEIK